MTNVAAAVVLFGSPPLLAGKIQCVELDQTAFWVPICGTGAAVQPIFASASLVVCHTPFQLKAVLPLTSALKLPSWATFAGLWPFLTRSVIHVRACTPASELKVAWVTSLLYSWPPICQINDSNSNVPVKT